MKTPAGNGWLSAFAIFILFPGVVRPVTAGDDRLVGRVADRSGAGIGGATVVLTALAPHPQFDAPITFNPDQPGEAVRVARTSTDGAFAATLPPGRYRVAAFKPGYAVSLIEVNTRVRSLVQMRLEEATRTLFGDLPEGSAHPDAGLGWILRGASGADVLRQEEGSVEAAVLPDPGLDSGSSRLASRLEAILEPIDGELVQRFSGATLLGDQAAGSGDLSGLATTLALRGSIGDEGSWSFDGLVGRLSTGAGDGSGGVRQGRSADRVQVGVDYSLGPKDSLKSDFRYGTSRYVVDPNGETVAATDQDQTSVGLRSRWERRLGETGQLYVEGSYRETAARVPDPGASLASPSGEDGRPDLVIDRSALTAAGLAFEVGEHRLDFGIRVKRYRYPLRNRGVLLYSLDDAPTLTEPGERGDAFSLYGSDDWRIGGRSILSYGVRYHSNVSAGNAYLVPQVGMTIEPPQPGGAMLRSMVLFRLDDPGISSLYSSAAQRRAAESRDIGRLGYALALERRPDNRVGFSTTFSYKPFEEGVAGDEAGVLGPGAWGDALIFLTDGAAGRHEMEFEVGRQFGGVRGSLSESFGRVDGRLTPAIEEAPVQILSLGEVRYSLTRLRAHYQPTDTEVRIDYRRVQAETALDDTSEPPQALDYQRLDLAVAQDLPRLRRVQSARFKVLMAYQGLVYGSSAGHGVTLPGVGPMATSRLTGGVDIRF